MSEKNKFILAIVIIIIIIHYLKLFWIETKETHAIFNINYHSDIFLDFKQDFYFSQINSREA